jgi:hypothetical protein
MFPSQRRALYQKLVKSSVGQFVSTVTVNDVEESMLELMPPSTFKANIGDIRDNIRKLSAQEMVNVAYFPNALVSFLILVHILKFTPVGNLNRLQVNLENRIAISEFTRYPDENSSG